MLRWPYLYLTVSSVLAKVSELKTHAIISVSLVVKFSSHDIALARIPFASQFSSQYIFTRDTPEPLFTPVLVYTSLTCATGSSCARAT